MQIPNLPGRTIFHAQEAKLEELKEKKDEKPVEKLKRTVVFTNMLKRDVPELQKIHDQAWRANEKGRSNLGLNIEKFNSYYENFGDFGICALLLDSGNPEGYTLIGGINSMRTNLAPRVKGVEPDIWTPIDNVDMIPRSWDELTNDGYFDTRLSHGNWKRIWPIKKGRAVICPTVYIMKKIEIGESNYKISPLMKGMITGVKNRTKLVVLEERRSVLVSAYSTPSSKFKHPNMTINEYLHTSAPNKEMLIESMTCEKDGIGGEDRQKRLYEAYGRSGGTVPFQDFVTNGIAEFSIMNEGMGAFISFCNDRRPLYIDEFLRITRRFPLDPTLGQHMFSGARIGKVNPKSRIDPDAENFNILMLYGVVRYADVLREEEERKRKQEENKSADAL